MAPITAPGQGFFESNGVIKSDSFLRPSRASAKTETASSSQESAVSNGSASASDAAIVSSPRYQVGGTYQNEILKAARVARANAPSAPTSQTSAAPETRIAAPPTPSSGTPTSGTPIQIQPVGTPTLISTPPVSEQQPTSARPERSRREKQGRRGDDRETSDRGGGRLDDLTEGSRKRQLSAEELGVSFKKRPAR